MQLTVQKGMRYAAEIKLSGIETWASDEDIIRPLEEAGFRDVVVYDISDEIRIVYGVWTGANTTVKLPDQVVYIEEAPL